MLRKSARLYLGQASFRSGPTGEAFQGAPMTGVEAIRMITSVPRRSISLRLLSQRRASSGFCSRSARRLSLRAPPRSSSAPGTGSGCQGSPGGSCSACGSMSISTEKMSTLEAPSIMAWCPMDIITVRSGTPSRT